MAEPQAVVKCEEWTMSSEREFMENLVQQRFNFLLVVYSLVIAGAMSTDSSVMFKVAFTLGFFLCTAVSFTVYRAHRKLDVILSLFHADPSHPVARVRELMNVDREANKNQGLWARLKRWNGCKSTHIIGVFIPMGCSLSMLLAAIASWVGWLTPT